MKAWECRRGELGFHDVERSHPRVGEIEVDVRYTGICGSDLPKLLCPSDFALPEPWRPGHEIVGTDTEGHWIAADPLVPCEHCRCCALGDTHLCPNLRRLGWDLQGGFAERVVMPVANAYSLPLDLDPVHAVLADPAAVAIHGLRCNAVDAPGRLAVIGAGTIGLLTALYAHETGWTVTVVHRNGRPPYPAVARAVPAELRSSSTLADNDAFDAVVDAATGCKAAPLEAALRIVRDGGTVVVQNAYHPGVTLQSSLRDLFRRSIRLIGSFSYCRRKQPEDFGAALAFLRDHPQQASHLVTEAGDLTALPTILVDESQRLVHRVLVVR